MDDYDYRPCYQHGCQAELSVPVPRPHRRTLFALFLLLIFFLSALNLRAQIG
jgi:hypothetical protein